MISTAHKALLGAMLVIVLFFPGLSNSSPDDIGGDFSLTDHNGQHFALKQLRGKVVLLFFGYTYCPDICPTELASMAKLTRSLGARKNKVQVLFISVDPARDSPEQLKAYVRFFSKDLVGLSGSEAEIEAVKDAYHVQSRVFREDENDENYSIDHSANLYVLDQQGKLVNIVPYGFPLMHVEEIVYALLENPDF